MYILHFLGNGTFKFLTIFRPFLNNKFYLCWINPWRKLQYSFHRRNHCKGFNYFLQKKSWLIAISYEVINIQIYSTYSSIRNSGYIKCYRLAYVSYAIMIIVVLQITALERGKKIEELQKRLLDSEVLRTRCTRKVTMLKDQVDKMLTYEHICIWFNNF